MTLDATIIKDSTSDTFTGFLNNYTGICSQADTVDQLVSNLKRNLKAYFNYMNNSNLELNQSEILSF